MVVAAVVSRRGRCCRTCRHRSCMCSSASRSVSGSRSSPSICSSWSRFAKTCIKLRKTKMKTGRRAGPTETRQTAAATPRCCSRCADQLIWTTSQSTTGVTSQRRLLTSSTGRTPVAASNTGRRPAATGNTERQQRPTPAGRL